MALAGVPLDLTGDGQRESVGYDTTGDGRVDALDTNGDGALDAHILRDVGAAAPIPAPSPTEPARSPRA